MWYLAAVPFLIHSLAMLVDEAWFHRRRGLPKWERWGHPADTLTILPCYVLALYFPATPGHQAAYGAAAVFSSLFITKDEWIHARHCTGGEMWLHAFLFTFHPVLLALVWAFWRSSAGPAGGEGGGRDFFALFLAGQTALTALFLGYQTLYWNVTWKRLRPPPA